MSGIRWLFFVFALDTICLVRCDAEPLVPVTGAEGLSQAQTASGVVEAFTHGWDAETVQPETVEAAMIYVAECAVLELTGLNPENPEIFAGKDCICEYWLDLLSGHLRVERSIERVEGGAVTTRSCYWTDSLRELDLAPLEVIEKIEIVEGKIVRVTWSPASESVSGLVTALTFTQLDPSFSTLPAPGARMWPTLAYLPDLDRMLLFGGGRLADAWIAAGGEYDWNFLPDQRVPSIDRLGGLRGAYDTSARRLILPVYEDGGVPLETWAFDPQTGAWENLNPANPPLGRRFADLVYDPRANKSILFGGALSEDMTRVSAETWVFDYPARAWTKMNSPQNPPALVYHLTIYDANPGRILVWGGQSASAENALWAYDVAVNQWTKTTYTEGPHLDYDGAAAYARELDRVFLYVGNQFWAYDDNNQRWAPAPLPPAPGSRSHAAGLAYDETHHRLILFGGATRTPQPMPMTLRLGLDVLRTLIPAVIQL